MWPFGKLSNVAAELRKLNYLLGQLIMTIAQTRADYKAYAQKLIAQRDEARTQRDTALALAQANADKAAKAAQDLQAFQDDDAATDASQLAAQQTEDALAFQSDLDELKALSDPEDPAEPAPSPTEAEDEAAEAAGPTDGE